MPEWTRFREAIAAGLPNTELLALLRKMSGWLELAPEKAMAALNEEMKSSLPRTLYQSLLILKLTIQRQADRTGLLSESQGTAADEGRRAAARLAVVQELMRDLLQKDPTLNQPPSAADLAKSKLQQAATEIFQRLDAVANQMAPGTVSNVSIKTIEDVRRDADALIATAAPNVGGLPFVLYMTGSATRMLAGCYAIVGRNKDALEAFAVAAEYFEKAGEPQQVEDCKSRARDLEQHLSGSLDAAAEQPLATVSAAASSGDKWERVKALMELSSIAGSAADTFEALQNAEAAVKELAGTKEIAGLGYQDPGECGAEAAMDSWIRTASAGLKGIALLGRVSQVGTWYDQILGARFAHQVRKDQAAANVLQALQVEVEKCNARMGQEARLAEAEVKRELESYFPPPGKAPEAPPSEADFDSLPDRMRAVDAALAQIRETCNQRAAAGQDMDDLLAAVGKLEAQADTLNSPEYEAKTRLERAYLLGHLGRGADMIPVAREARSRLLAGRAASLSSFAQSHQRHLYLDSLKREAMGRIMTGDFEGSLKICEETVRDFETQRYRVNSEYRQSALLSYVSDFYTWAVFSAFRLKRWDEMLEAIELIKARSAIRSRLMPDKPERLNLDLLREFDAVNADLERAPNNENFKVKRRQLWDLLSIAHAQDGESGEIPAPGVATVQAALDEDEALIGYFWLSGTVILAVAVDRERFLAERIVLKPEELDRIKEFVSFVQALKSSHKMDREVAELGDILLPDFLRDFMKSKRRIIFSPHHSLHLFPFQAARWGTEGFVGTEFAVRYVPNFCSVLLPWARRTEDRILAIGIREFADPAVQPLDNVEEDAAVVAGFYRASGSRVETLLGKDASRAEIETLRENGTLQKFRCVHLGTHGLSVFATPEQPLESRLLVQDGTLDAMDIANLRLSAELVMLSACHSGQRAIELRDLGEVPGDDIFGLQSALFKSGVRSVTGTLWLVETKSSSPITRAFHRHYAEGKPAEVALQLAVKEYLANAPARLSGVYYWAPYFISSIGSSGRMQTGRRDSWQS